MNLRDFKRPDPKILDQYREIVGDEIGVTVVPSANLKDVIEAARTQAEREEATRRRIAQGRTFEQLLEEFGRI